MASLQVLLSLLFLTAAPFSVNSFNCSNVSVSCSGLVGYVPSNATTIGEVKSLFGVKNLFSLLGANNLPLSTSPNFTVVAQKAVKVPFRCGCGNGTGRVKSPPIYTVVAGDGLFNIAAKVFAGLVTVQQIQAFNGIKNVDLITIGQKLKIPLPCSCDEVDGEKVVHYGHMVAPESTVEGIAQEFGTSADTLLKVNGLASSKELVAGVTIDVPLKACTSMVGTNSLDYPLLVVNGTYAVTATNCVSCKCDAANNWTLQCQSSNITSSRWATCPAITCAVASGCVGSNDCAYAGYNNQTINATPINTTCTDPQKKNDASKLVLRGWSTSSVLIFINLLLFCHFNN